MQQQMLSCANTDESFIVAGVMQAPNDPCNPSAAQDVKQILGFPPTAQQFAAHSFDRQKVIDYGVYPMVCILYR